MNKVSVLVAVYNAAKYLPQCLDSLRAQTHTDLQVLCVDDASTDDSLAILNRYAAADSRFVVIHQDENTGQARARNHALLSATGDFITMLDADDYFAPDALEKAVEVMVKDPITDAVLFSVVERYEPEGEEHPYPVRSQQSELSGIEAMYLSLEWDIHGLYLLRGNIFRDHPYDTSCRLYSDDNTTRIHYLNCRRVRFCEGIYYYRKHPESCTNALSMLHFDYMEANLSMMRQLEALDMDSLILSHYERHRWLNFVGEYWYYYSHREAFSDQKEMIFFRMRSILHTIVLHRIPFRYYFKLGYIPVKSFRLFRWQEELYFRLRHRFCPSSEHVI